MEVFWMMGKERQGGRGTLTDEDRVSYGGAQFAHGNWRRVGLGKEGIVLEQSFQVGGVGRHDEVLMLV